MNIFEQYGIKEVADVTIYRLVEENGQTIERPYLFLDTLKVSTLEQTAEEVEAKGGIGNAPIIMWDFGKEINVLLEDALYTPRSMAMKFGGSWEDLEVNTVKFTRQIYVDNSGKYNKLVIKNPVTNDEVVILEEGEYNPMNFPNSLLNLQVYDSDGRLYEEEKLSNNSTYFVEWDQLVTNTSKTLKINADSFPGTYKIVGETYTRNRDTGEDEYFQFIVPRAKLTAENELTLEADGDPAVFNLNMRVLNPESGPMMQLIQFELS